MSDQTEEQSQTPADQAPQEQETKPLFSVGDRQYDEQAAVKKIQSADAHISTLEQESKQKEQTIAELQAKLDQATKLEDALRQMKQPQPENEDMSNTTDATTQLDMEALKAELLQQAQQAATSSVQTYEQQKMATANQADSINAAKARYGSEYEAKLREAGTQLGLDDAAIDSMAKSNPALFKQTFGLNAKHNAGVYPDGSVSTTANVKKPELKQVNKHWSTTDKVGAQLHNETELGKMIKEAGGDYNAVAQALGVSVKNFANN